MIRFSKILVLVLSSVVSSSFTLYPSYFWLSGNNKGGASLGGPISIEKTFADSLIYPPIRVDPFNLPILAPSAGVQFYKDGILFLSSSKIQKKMIPEQISFGRAESFSAVLEDSVLGNPEVFSPDFPFPYPSGAVSFSRDYLSIYFTRYTGGKLKIHKAIYTNTLKRTGWLQDQDPLSFCEDGYNFAQPALSPEGKFIVFSSDREPSVGGMDLYVSYLEGEGWARPKELGDKINTAVNELFPFIDRNNNLFFSSNGLPGKGGYDIYFSKFNGESWETPVNLSKDINSVNDELAFRMNFKGEQAFFSSGETGKGMNRQLYRVSFLETDLEMDKYFLSNALKENSEPLENFPPTGSLVQETNEEPESKTIAGIEGQGRNEKLITTKKINEEIALRGDTMAVTGTGEPQAEKENTTEKSNIAANIPVTISPKKPEPEKNIEIKSEKTPVPEPVLKIPGQTTPEKPEVEKKPVVYRVQFASSTKSKGSYLVDVNGKEYQTWEYYYKGAYRVTVGEFTTLSEAAAFQNLCRKSGYPQAFVAAFIDGIRSLDPALFR